MKPIYKPKGAAAEYGDYAVNIYTGCPHRCYYCFAPQVLHREREAFHSCVEPRKGIVAELRRQLEREVIKALKEYGNHVQILTKGDGSRDFDLLDGEDWYGVTYSGADTIDEPCALERSKRLFTLAEAKSKALFAEAVARGRIQAPGFFSDPVIRKAYTECMWNGPSRTALNPSQEVEAAVKRVDAGFSTAEDEAAQLTGSDYRKNIRKRVTEAKLKREVDKINSPPATGAGQTPPDTGGQEGGTGNAQ